MLIHTKDFDTGRALVNELGISKTPWKPIEGLFTIEVEHSTKVKAAVRTVRSKFGQESVTTEAAACPVRVLGKMVPGKPETFVGKRRQTILTPEGIVCLAPSQPRPYRQK